MIPIINESKIYSKVNPMKANYAIALKCLLAVSLPLIVMFYGFHNLELKIASTPETLSLDNLKPGKESDFYSLKKDDPRFSSATDAFSPDSIFLGISIGTYARENICTIALEVNGVISDWQSCKDLKDNQTNFFKFPRNFKPELSNLRLLKKGQEGNFEIAVYSVQEEEKHWIEVWQAFPNVSNWDLAAWRYGKTTATLLSGLGICLGLLFFFCAGFYWHYIYLLVISLLIMFIVTPRYAGHDETAHITMFRSATQMVLPDIDSSTQGAFFRNVKADMLTHYFDRLHRISLDRIGDSCPHMIVGGCGETAKPTRLYWLYAHFFMVNGGADFDSPSVYIQTGSLINLALFTSIVILSLMFLPAFLRELYLFMVIFLGCIYLRLPTLNSDLIAFFIGMLAVVPILKATNFERQNTVLAGKVIYYLKLVIPFTCGVMLTFVGYQFESSALVGLYTFCFVLVYQISCSCKNATYNAQSKCKKWSFLIEPSMLLILNLVAVYFIVHLIASVSWSKFAILEISYLNSFKSLSEFPLREIPRAYYKTFQTALGSFVWGNLFYSPIFYISGLMISVVLSCIGFFRLQKSNIVGKFLHFMVIHMFILALVGPLALAGHRFNTVNYGTFLEIRLLSPLFPILFIFMLRGLVHLDDLRARRILFRIAVLFIACGVYAKGPAIFIKSIFY
jgi:hypothetical protein